MPEFSDLNVKHAHPSFPAIAGKGDHPKGGGRGVGLDDTLSTTVKRRVRRPFHRARARSPLPRLHGGGSNASHPRASCLVIARSQRVRPEVAGPMTGSATKQSRAEPPDSDELTLGTAALDCFAALAMTKKRKGKRNADRRLLQPAVQLARPRILRDALACRRSTAVLTYGLSPVARDFRPGFLGRGESARSCNARPTGAETCPQF